MQSEVIGTGGRRLQIKGSTIFSLDMIVVGAGSDERPGCYLGVGATTHPRSGRFPDAVKEDELGLYAARILGKRVAEVVQWNERKENQR